MTVDDAVFEALFALVAGAAASSGGLLPVPQLDPGLANLSSSVQGTGDTRSEAWLCVTPVAPLPLQVELGGPEGQSRLIEHRMDIDWIVLGDMPAPGTTTSPARTRFMSGKALLESGLALPRAITPGHAGLIASQVWVEWDETTLAPETPGRSIMSSTPNAHAATLRVRALYTATSPLAN